MVATVEGQTLAAPVSETLKASEVWGALVEYRRQPRCIGGWQ